MIWYVHRNEDGSIASAHSEPMPGYAEEARDDTTAEDIIAHREAAARAGEMKVPPK